MKRQCLAVIMVMSGILLLTMTSSVLAVPGTINYQGKLTDAGSIPLDGVHDMVFRLYNVANGGAELWSETQGGVTITNGLCSVELGASVALEAAFFTGSPLF